MDHTRCVSLSAAAWAAASAKRQVSTCSSGRLCSQSGRPTGTYPGPVPNGAPVIAKRSNLLEVAEAPRNLSKRGVAHGMTKMQLRVGSLPNASLLRPQ